MGNELQSVDVATAIKDKIKAQFVDLIPDEAFQKMVEAEIHSFTTPKGDSWNNNRQSPLQKLIQQEIEDRLKVSIKAELDKPEYQPIWTNSGYQLPDHFKKVIIEAAPLILEQMISSQTSNILNNMRNMNY